MMSFPRISSTIHLMLVILLVYCSLRNVLGSSLHVAHTSLRINNELEQFYQYEKLSFDHQNINSTKGIDVLKTWNDCLVKTSINFAHATCAAINAAQLEDALRSVGNPFPKYPRDPDKRQPDCQYVLDFHTPIDPTVLDHQDEEDHKNYFSFHIKKSSCKSDSIKGLASIKGGSSFFIVAASNYHQVNCQVRDQFDGNYLVYCPVSRSFQMRVVNNLSHSKVSSSAAAIIDYKVHLTVILDYEHFDAFSEIYSLPPALDFVILNDTHFSINTTSGSHQQHSTGSGKSSSRGHSLEGTLMHLNDSLYSHRAPSSSWIRRTPMKSEPFFDSNFNTQSFSYQGSPLNGSHVAAHTDLINRLYDYSWTGNGNTFPTAEAFERYFMNKSHQFSALIGESHMRYTWDFYYYLYYGSNKLSKFSRKHGYADDISGLVLYSKMFAGDVGAVMPKLDCDMAGKKFSSGANKKTYAFQTGSWDLSTAPLRNFIRNPSAALYMLQSIKERVNQVCTADIMRLIWVTIMPFPRCLPGMTTCNSGAGFRNNYAIAAANSWLYKELQAIDSEKIYVVNLDNIFHPRLLSVHPAQGCGGNHFLCHDKAMTFSSLGVAAAGEILRCMMWVNSGFSESIDCHPINRLLDRSAFHHYAMRAKRHQHHAFVRLLEYEKDSKNPDKNELYVIEGNLRSDAPANMTVSDLQQLLPFMSNHGHHSAYVKVATTSELNMFPHMDQKQP